MNKHLIEIGKCVSPGAIALLIVDGAGWHSSPKLVVPENIVLLKLPPYALELNPAENIWNTSEATLSVIKSGKPTKLSSMRVVRHGTA